MFSSVGKINWSTFAICSSLAPIPSQSCLSLSGPLASRDGIAGSIFPAAISALAFSPSSSYPLPHRRSQWHKSAIPETSPGPAIALLAGSGSTSSHWPLPLLRKVDNLNIFISFLKISCQIFVNLLRFLRQLDQTVRENITDCIASHDKRAATESQSRPARPDLFLEKYVEKWKRYCIVNTYLVGQSSLFKAQ